MRRENEGYKSERLRLSQVGRGSNYTRMGAALLLRSHRVVMKGKQELVFDRPLAKRAPR